MENTGKFVIERVKPRSVSFATVRIWEDTFLMLKELSEENHVHLCQLIDDMVRYCVEHLEVVEVEE